MDGPDGKEAAVAARGQSAPRVLREQERAREQDAEEVIPPLFGKLGDRRDVLEARARHDRVETAEPRECRLDDGSVRVARRQVAVGEINGMHAPPVRRETLRNRPADPARRARHERRLHRRKRKTSSAAQTGFS